MFHRKYGDLSQGHDNPARNPKRPMPMGKWVDSCPLPRAVVKLASRTCENSPSTADRSCLTHEFGRSSLVLRCSHTPSSDLLVMFEILSESHFVSFFSFRKSNIRRCSCSEPVCFCICYGSPLWMLWEDTPCQVRRLRTMHFGYAGQCSTDNMFAEKSGTGTISVAAGL